MLVFSLQVKMALAFSVQGRTMSLLSLPFGASV